MLGAGAGSPSQPPPPLWAWGAGAEEAGAAGVPPPQPLSEESPPSHPLDSEEDAGAAGGGVGAEPQPDSDDASLPPLQFPPPQLSPLLPPRVPLSGLSSESTQEPDSPLPHPPPGALLGAGSAHDISLSLSIVDTLPPPCGVETDAEPELALLARWLEGAETFSQE